MAEEGHLPNVNETIELTRKLTPDSFPTTVFTGIGAGGAGESRVLAIRVCLGFGTVAGIARVTAAVPGVAPGTLQIQQSVDGTNWDLSNDTAMTLAGGTVSFAYNIFGRFIRALFTVPAGEEYAIRFGAQLKPNSSV